MDPLPSSALTDGGHQTVPDNMVTDVRTVMLILRFQILSYMRLTIKLTLNASKCYFCCCFSAWERNHITAGSWGRHK
jgi:hypothetical protein